MMGLMCAGSYLIAKLMCVNYRNVHIYFLNQFSVLVTVILAVVSEFGFNFLFSIVMHLFSSVSYFLAGFFWEV